MVVLLMAYIISWGFLIASEYSKKFDRFRLLFKGITSFIFLLTGVLTAINSRSEINTLFSVLMCVALFFCFLGDVFLSVKQVGSHFGWLLAGATLFMAAHGVFFLAFNTVLPFVWQDAVLIAVVTIAVYSLSFMKSLNVAEKKSLLFAYALFLGLLMSKSLTLFAINGYTAFTATILTAGLLFAASDILLIIQLVGTKSIKLFPFFNLLLYYSATMLLALSIGKV